MHLQAAKASASLHEAELVSALVKIDFMSRARRGVGITPL